MGVELATPKYHVISLAPVIVTYPMRVTHSARLVMGQARPVPPLYVLPATVCQHMVYARRAQGEAHDWEQGW
jgi:hypothetical protein